MNLFKKIVCFVMVAVLTFTLAACTGNQPGVQQNGDIEDRKPYEQKTETVFKYTEDTDGDFEYKEVEWEGPKGYVIVVPAGNSEAKTTAETLQGYFQRYAKLTLSIVTDKTAETEKEILIGKTSRADSKKDLAEAKLEVSVKGKKLVFDGGHDVTVDSAVKKFTRLTYNEGKAYAYSLETDFKSKPGLEGMEDYVYVWGDEFEEARYDDINWTKWRFNHGMTGTKNEIITSKDRCVADIDDGRLQLFAINYYNVEKPKIRYIAPWSVSTKFTMAYVYGYAEIRAKVPFLKGTWPSWWGGSGTSVPGARGTTEYHTEIDVFEIFGSEEAVVPNLHKWYEGYDYAGNHNVEEQHSASGTDYNYQFKKHQDISNLSNEYHIYGFFWTPKEMSMWVDGTKYQTFDINKSWDLYEDMQGFHDPSFLQFNNHVFADDSTFRPNVITNDVDTLPSQYFIDYFRVYQKPGEGRIYTETNPTDEAAAQEDRPIEKAMYAERR